jgi:type I restriction enzyme S subunit
LDKKNTVPLGTIVENDRPITYGILKPGISVQGGVPVIKVKDMKDGFIDQTDLLFTTPEIDNNYKRSRLRAGDLLISIRGSIGRMAEVPENLENANITQDTARLSIKKEYNKVFIRGVLESHPLQYDMEKNIRGVAVKGINIGYLRDLEIPVCNRDKQDELAALYMQSDKSKFHINMMSREVTACLMKIIQLNRW